NAAINEEYGRAAPGRRNPISGTVDGCARAATDQDAAPPTSPMTPRRFKSRMESPLLPTGRAMAWWHSQSTSVRNVSQAGRPVLGLDLKCSESDPRSAWVRSVELVSFATFPVFPDQPTFSYSRISSAWIRNASGIGRLIAFAVFMLTTS